MTTLMSRMATAMITTTTTGTIMDTGAATATITPRPPISACGSGSARF